MDWVAIDVFDNSRDQQRTIEQALEDEAMEALVELEALVAGGRLGEVKPIILAQVRTILTEKALYLAKHGKFGQAMRVQRIVDATKSEIDVRARS